MPQALRTNEIRFRANGAVNWDAFPAHEYWKKNYAFMRADDRRFLERLRDFFGDEAATLSGGRGIDVGSGANIYPALAMLPLCDEITLLEYGEENHRWLTREVAKYSPQWDKYWQTLRVHPAYADLGVRGVRDRLARTTKVARGSVFEDLTPDTYDVGTMFFVAESITDDPEEFRNAVKSFMTSLKSGAPFAAAFMRNSTGYTVKNHDFPAFRIDEDGIGSCLKELATDFKLWTVDTRGLLEDADDKPEAVPTRRLRPGYDGMILALGHVA